MKLSKPTVQQLFILKLLKENSTFEIKKRGNQYWLLFTLEHTKI